MTRVRVNEEILKMRFEEVYGRFAWLWCTNQNLDGVICFWKILRGFLSSWHAKMCHAV